MNLGNSIKIAEEMMKKEESVKEKILKTIERESSENIILLFSLCNISLFTLTHDEEVDNLCTGKSFSNIYILHQILNKGDIELLKKLIKKEERFKQRLTSFINKNLIDIETLAIYSSNKDVFELCLDNISYRKLKAVFINMFTKKKTNIISGSHHCNLSLLVKYVKDKQVITEEEINNIFKNTVDVDITVLDIFFNYSTDKERILFNGLKNFIKKENEQMYLCNIQPSKYEMLRKKQELSILETWIYHFSEKDFKKIYDNNSKSNLYDLIDKNLSNTFLYNIILNNSLYFNVAKANINSKVKIIMKSDRI